MYAAGANPDEDLRREACQMMRFQKYTDKKSECQLEVTSKKRQKSSQDPTCDTMQPDWLRELHAVLVEYWETGEVSDDIEDEWFDEMIERVTPLALQEM